VICGMVNNILHQHSKQLENNFFGCQIYSIFQGDSKLNEIIALGCFALKHSHFQAIPISQLCVSQNEEEDKKKNKNKISPPSIDTATIATFAMENVVTSPEMKCLTNEEFEEFVLNIEQVGIASPLNVQYPAIDGVLHFRLISNNKEEWITAFVQYSVSETHPFSPEAVITLESHMYY
jgi:hypothetical protein